MKNKDLLDPLVDDLIRRESDPGEIHVCPYCKGELHVSIRIYGEGQIHIAGELVKIWGDRYLGAGANCKNCNATLVVQYGAEAIPPWAKESEYKDMSADEIWELLRKDSEEH